MYNPNRVFLSKDTKTLKHRNTFANTQKWTNPKWVFLQKEHQNPTHTDTFTNTHTHQNAQTQLEFVCLQKSTKTLSIQTPSQKHTHTHTHKMHKPKQSFPSKCATIQNRIWQPSKLENQSCEKLEGRNKQTPKCIYITYNHNVLWNLWVLSFFCFLTRSFLLSSHSSFPPPHPPLLLLLLLLECYKKKQ